MYCPVCGIELIKYGYTSTGKQRYKCTNCSYVQVIKNPNVNPDIERLEAWIRRLERRVEQLEQAEPEVNPNKVGKNAYSK